MGNRSENNSRVKPIFAYLRNSIKFYDTQNPLVARFVFLLMLAVIFGGYLFARPYTETFYKAFEQISRQLQSQLENKTLDLSLIGSDLYTSMINSFMTGILIILVINVFSFIAGLFYESYYYFSLIRPSQKGRESILIFLRRLPKLIIFNIMYYLLILLVVLIIMIVTGFAAMLAPFFLILFIALPFFIIVLNTLYIFKDLLILEFDVGVFRNFKMSPALTRGSRKNIILNALWPVCMGWILNTFAAGVENALLSLLITSFLEVIILLFSIRLKVLMFIDAAFIEKKENPEVETMA